MRRCRRQHRRVPPPTSARRPGAAYVPTRCPAMHCAWFGWQPARRGRVEGRRPGLPTGCTRHRRRAAARSLPAGLGPGPLGLSSAAWVAGAASWCASPALANGLAPFGFRTVTGCTMAHPNRAQTLRGVLVVVRNPLISTLPVLLATTALGFEGVPDVLPHPDDQVTEIAREEIGGGGVHLAVRGVGHWQPVDGSGLSWAPACWVPSSSLPVVARTPRSTPRTTRSRCAP